MTRTIPTVLVPTTLLLAACHREPAADGGASSSESTGDPGEPTPGAPDENCPGRLDPTRVYVALQTGNLQDNVALVHPVDAPDEVCAYLASWSQPFVGVRNGGLQFVQGTDAGWLMEVPQGWLRWSAPPPSVGDWHVEGSGRQEVLSLGCPIGAAGTFFPRQRFDGDVGFYCADGIGGRWVYDRPSDPTPIDVAQWSRGDVLVAPLPGDRWLLPDPDPDEDGTGLSVLQGDGQMIDVVATDGTSSINPIVARATETGALIAGYGAEGVQLCEIVGEQLSCIATYEHGMEIDWPFYNAVSFDSSPLFLPALGADGTLAAVVYVQAEDGFNARRAVWMRPDTPVMIAAEAKEYDPARPDEFVDVFGVLSQ